MKTKELIEQYLNSPVKIGDSVHVRGRGLQDKNAWGHTAVVVEVLENEDVKVEGYHRQNETEVVAKDNYRKNTYYIGTNPFAEKPWNSSLRVVAFGLDSILHSVGFDRRNKEYLKESFSGIDVPELNWNPYFLKDNGEKVYYQRGFVWSLNDKKLLIESIYNSIDIGKIVIRKRSFDWIREQIESGNTEVSFKDIVDGKQRINAIIEFLEDKYTDLHGNYYSDLSGEAVNKFMNFRSISYGELGEEASDEDVKSVFLGVNFTGVQMSQEHIDFVKKIKL